MTLVATPSRERASPTAATSHRILRLSGAPASAKGLLLALLRVEGGGLIIHTPDSEMLMFGDRHGPAAELIVHDYRFASRVVSRGDIGFAEGWIEGEWTSPDLATLLTLLSANADRVMRYFKGGAFARLLSLLAHMRRPNSRGGARRNILAHYDLGNEFFSAWLDPSMTYSAARFDRASELEAAQLEKYGALAEKLELQRDEHILEIGCGWGGFAEYAARSHGARVTAITISDQQYAYARRRVAAWGLADRIDIQLKDYRDVHGQFDKVASIEMIEGVGEAYWPAYFQKIADVLKSGGRAAIQAITIRDDLFEAYRWRADFIQHYIFPGGMLPSLKQLRDRTREAGLRWCGAEAFGQSYAQTLAAWAQRFQSNWRHIMHQGYDERFRRLWCFYLAYCEAGFRSARTDVLQLTLKKE